MEGTGYALGYMPRPDISFTDILEAAIDAKKEKSNTCTNTEIKDALNKVWLLPYSDIPKLYDELFPGTGPNRSGGSRKSGEK